MSTKEQLIMAYEKLTDKTASETFTATHNHDCRGERVSQKLGRVARQLDETGRLGTGTLNRVISGGISIRSIVNEAGVMETVNV